MVLRLETLPLRRLGHLAAAFALVAIFVAIFLPLQPSFPGGTQLDSSWIIALHEAMRVGLPFGDRIVFTFGPYASIYTGQYHESTDNLMLVGSAILAVCYAAMMLRVAHLRGVRLGLIVAFFVLILFPHKDALLFAYPLLFCVFVYLHYTAAVHTEEGNAPAQRFALVLFLIPFGLLPLVKGSALIACAASALLCIALLHHAKRRIEATLVAAVPIIACVVFWAASGQPVASVVPYFVNLLPIISGYTDAMSSWGSIDEIWSYLAATAVLLSAILLKSNETRSNRSFLGLAFAVFLFLAFKGGFVRHDGHAMLAAASAGIAALFALFVRVPAAPLVLFAGFGCWTLIDAHQAKTSTEQVYWGAINRFESLAEGWRARSANDGRLSAIKLEQQKRLSAECPVQKLEGSVDIYSFRQACLIFSGNVWSPRPIFQSYSAYTPGLAAMNAEHLLSSHAPRHVLFRLESIDNRLPALDDGPSWPLLLELYAPRWIDGDLAYLERREASPQPLAPEYGVEMQAKLSEPVTLPAHVDVLMAQITLRPTLLGRVASILFKNPAPSIEIETDSGAKHAFRFVPAMGASGFILSPHIATTRDFLLVQEGSTQLLRNSRVKRIRLFAQQGLPFWSEIFTVRFAPLKVRPSDTWVAREKVDMALASPPLQGKVSKTTVCEGSIDKLNGVSPAPMEMRSGSIITLDGWTAASAARGALPDDVYIVISQGANKTYYRSHSTRRPDVRDHFGQPGLLNSGFEAHIDASGMKGSVTLHLAQVTQGKLLHCEPFRRLVISY